MYWTMLKSFYLCAINNISMMFDFFLSFHCFLLNIVKLLCFYFVCCYFIIVENVCLFYYYACVEAC